MCNQSEIGPVKYHHPRSVAAYVKGQKLTILPWQLYHMQQELVFEIQEFCTAYDMDDD